MLTSSRISRKLGGNNTEMILQAFSDRILVLITQMGKVGNLVIQASIPATTPLPPPPAEDPSQPDLQPLPSPPPAIQLTPLLGNAPTEHMQTLHSLYAAQIATIIWTAESEGVLEVDRRNVIVGIALQKSEGGDSDGLSEQERNLFVGVMEMLRDSLKCT